MISLVVPTYNERANIGSLLQRVSTTLASTGIAFEIIVVDDKSPDGTADEVRRLAQAVPWLRLIVRQNERDLSTAIMAGWQEARGDVLGCIDADLQHPPEALVQMVKRLSSTGADIVVGSRRVAGAIVRFSVLRRCTSWAATLLAVFVLPGATSDSTRSHVRLFSGAPKST